MGLPYEPSIVLVETLASAFRIDLRIEDVIRSGVRADPDGPPDWTAGMLLALVFERLDMDAASAKVRPLRPAFRLVQAAVAQSCRVSAPRVRPSTRLDDLLPRRWRRRAVWSSIHRRIGVGETALELPPRVEHIAAITTLATFAAGVLLVLFIGIFGAWWILATGTSPTRSSLFTGLLAGMMGLWALGVAANPIREVFGRQVPADAGRVRDLAVRATRALPPRSLPWSVELAWYVVRQVVAEVAGCDARQVRPSTRLFADLRVEPPTCLQCGYDMRSSPDACPECGMATAEAFCTGLGGLDRFRDRDDPGVHPP